MLAFYRKCGIKCLASTLRLGPRGLVNPQFRNYAGKCESEDDTSKCGAAILKEYPCNIKKEKKSEPKKKRPVLVSMWKIKDCDPDRCVLPLRYDMKYYTITDNSKRKYQVTWNECPRLLIKPKKVCLYEKIRRPKIERRKRSPGGPVIAADGAKSCILKTEGSKSKCVYIKTPCCKIGRRPPKCKSAFPSLGNCEKRRAPYPSYSECKREETIPAPPSECGCLNLPAICDAWAVLRNRVARGQNIVKKCGDA